MKKESIGIIVCIILIVTSIPVSGFLINNDAILIDFSDTFDNTDFEFYQSYKQEFVSTSDFGNNVVNTNLDIFGDVDLSVRGRAWISPTPWKEGYICLNYEFIVENIGQESYEGAWLYCYVYCIYPTYEESGCTYLFIQGFQKNGRVYGESSRRLCLSSEKPIGYRFEIKCNISESNLENNVKTVGIGKGVTFYGNVYKKTLSGDIFPYQCGVNIWANSNVEPYLHNGWYRTIVGDEEGFYCLSVPKKPNSLPFKYTLLASLDDRYFGTRIRSTERLDDLEYAKIDFNFGILSKSVYKNNIFPQLFVNILSRLRHIFEF